MEPEEGITGLLRADRSGCYALLLDWSDVAGWIKGKYLAPPILNRHVTFDVLMDKMLDQGLDMCNGCGVWGEAWSFVVQDDEPYCDKCKEG